MTSVSQPVPAPTVVLSLSEPKSGQIQVEVPPHVHARYQELKGRGILTKEKLARLASNDGTIEITAERVIAAIQIPTNYINRRLTELDRAARASEGSGA
jgi:hypothetical protein